MTAMDPDGEMEQAINIVQNAHDGILSIVIDSYNYKNFLENACLKGHELNEEIINFLNKTEGNKIVFRPDSGEPISTTIDCLEIIKREFGTQENSKGFKTFNANICLLGEMV